MDIITPISKLNEWLDQEKKLGSTSADRMVLATASKMGVPHSRIVAIREITEKGVLFFTQKGTRKVIELTENPYASMTLWLPLQQRQVILDGITKKLTEDENKYYWNAMSRERQLRFSAYAPTSGQVINSMGEIEHELQILSTRFKHEIPMSEFYCGFRLIPNTFYFYTLGTETFSEVISYTNHDENWEKQILSP